MWRLCRLRDFPSCSRYWSSCCPQSSHPGLRPQVVAIMRSWGAAWLLFGSGGSSGLLLGSESDRHREDPTRSSDAGEILANVRSEEEKDEEEVGALDAQLETLRKENARLQEKRQTVVAHMQEKRKELKFLRSVSASSGGTSGTKNQQRSSEPAVAAAAPTPPTTHGASQEQNESPVAQGPAVVEDSPAPSLAAGLAASAHGSGAPASNVVSAVETQAPVVQESSAAPAVSAASAQPEVDRRTTPIVSVPARSAGGAPAEDPDAAFHQFMAEEDGEDDLNDPAYQEAARALSASTGWNQEEIEGKANAGIKGLTQAIGGGKTVGALSRMLGALR